MAGELLDKLNSHLCLWCTCRHLGIQSISFYKLSMSVSDLFSAFTSCSRGNLGNFWRCGKTILECVVKNFFNMNVED